MADFNLNDPATFKVSSDRTSVPLKNFSYTTQTTYTDKNGVSRQQYITVTSNSLLDEEQILGLAESYLRGGAKYNGVNSIDDIEVTGAMRSRAVGE